MDTMITLLLTSAAGVLSGMVLFLLQRHFKKQQKREEERERNKAMQIILILKSLKALGNLTVANSVALRDGKTNGELKQALKEFELVNEELYNSLISARQEN